MQKRSPPYRERANLFAARTDAEIRALERKAAADPQPKADGDGPAPFRLSRVEAQHIAIRFFREQDDRNMGNGDYLADPRSPGYDDILIEAGLDYQAAYQDASGEQRTSEGTARRVLVEQGYLPRSLIETRRSRVPEEILKDREFQFLCRLIERAQIELSKRRLDALQNGAIPPIGDTFFAAPLATAPGPFKVLPAGPRKTVADLVSSFEDWKRTKVGQSRMSQFQIAGRALREHLGDGFLLSEITRQHCKEIVDLFVRVPPYVAQHFKGLTLEAAAGAYERKHGQPAARHEEAQKNLSVLRQMLGRAVHEEWMSDNPALKVDAPAPEMGVRKHHVQSDGYEPFDVHELKKIFSAPLYTGCLDDERGYNVPGPNIVRRHRFWVPLVALWTGARMGEILQLERADVRQDESGIWYLAITDEEAGEYDAAQFQKRLKTKNSIRDIPIHPELQKLGFVGWATSQPAGRLFPEAEMAASGKLSDMYSKWFKRFLAAQGVWKARRKVFHSFRNSFTDALRDGGVPEELRIAINGWAAQEAMDKRYGRGHKVQRLYEEVKKVAYPGLDLSPLYTKGD